MEDNNEFTPDCAEFCSCTPSQTEASMEHVKGHIVDKRTSPTVCAHSRMVDWVRTRRGKRSAAKVRCLECGAIIDDRPTK
jgi:hypothetical protein